MSDSDERMLEGDSPEVITKTGNTTTEEVTNADLFSLLKTYMNNKLSGIEKNLNDTTQDLAKKVKKSENSLKFKGNQVQFELNTDIQDNVNSALKYIQCDRSKKAITLIEESLAALKKTQQIDTHSGQVGRRLEDCRRIPV
jgi:membrane peptidoglycan carboxypeptidase